MQLNPARSFRESKEIYKVAPKHNESDIVLQVLVAENDNSKKQQSYTLFIRDLGLRSNSPPFVWDEEDRSNYDAPVDKQMVVFGPTESLHFQAFFFLPKSLDFFAFNVLGKMEQASVMGRVVGQKDKLYKVIVKGYRLYRENSLLWKH